MTVQQTLGAVPIKAASKPPEGKLSAAFRLTLTPAEPSYAQAWQLNNASGGLPLSQVVSLSIDNTKNPYSIAVTHGALNETIIVPSLTQLIVPTFSNASDYTILIALTSENVPAYGVAIGITLYNYQRSGEAFSGGLGYSIAGSKQNSTNLYSNVVQVTPSTPAIVVIQQNTGQWIVDSLDIGIEGFLAAIPNQVAVLQWQLYTQTAPAFIPLALGLIEFTPTTTDWIPGAAIGEPVRKSWRNGFIGPNNGPLYWDLNLSGNFSTISLRINVSGILIT